MHYSLAKTDTVCLCSCLFSTLSPHCQKFGSKWRTRVRIESLMAAKSCKEMYGISTKNQSKHIQEWLSCTSNITLFKGRLSTYFQRYSIFEASHYLLFVSKHSVIHGKWSSIWGATAPRSQLAPTRIKYREVRSEQIVHKKRHLLTLRYFQKSLKIAIFTLRSLWSKTILENAREGKTIK